MSTAIVMATAASTELHPEPIPRDWILAGSPDARSAKLAKSDDFTSYVMVWDCSEGHFNWHYNKDETLVVVSGEAFITTTNREERRIGPGDLVFFPAGSSATWRVTQQVRKVAVLRETMPMSVGAGLRVWNKLLRVVGLAGTSPLLFALLITPRDWLFT
jgi:uncharacterized protein